MDKHFQIIEDRQMISTVDTYINGQRYAVKYRIVQDKMQALVQNPRSGLTVLVVVPCADEFSGLCALNDHIPFGREVWPDAFADSNFNI